MSILVLGGAGYIGSHTVKELLAAGYETVVVDTLEKGHKEAVDKRSRLYMGDLRDEDLMDKVFTENEIDGVIDFAAYSLVGESVAHPAKYYENNVNGMILLLKYMKKHNVDKIVFSSTAATYGEPKNIPILETDPTIPTNPYGETKLSIEKMLKWYGAAYGIRYVALRYFNVAGAHESGEIGEDHQPETHLIPLVLETALGKREHIEIYGDDYDTPDGTCIRDYIHVTDLAAAHILALEKLMNGGDSSVYNLGNGKGFSNKEIVETARKVTGKEIPLQYGERRAGDPSTLVASSEKIIKELNWQPRFNTLDQIIESAWKWHSGHPTGY